jgi:pyruvate kinase
MKRTKIVCTIGPASDTLPKLKALAKSGMNVARLNFSHNVQAYHLKVLKNVRTASRELKIPIAAVADLQGPRIRLGELPEKGIKLIKGKNITLSTAETADFKKIPVTYKKMHKDVKPGERILLIDGLIEIIVEKIKDTDIICKVKTGGTLFTHKGINLPDTNVRLHALSEKDKEDLHFAVKNKVDYVALSFVKNAQEIKDLKTLIKEYQRKLKINLPYPIKIIVKIERREAITNLAEIIAEADAVMIARGDLGVEFPPEDVPILQKMIIDKCLFAAKPVITATQMLESMVKNPRPTRAEASDVSNAVIDHTDAVMLSAESAVGDYPKETVSIMSDILIKTEESVYDDLVLKKKILKLKNNDYRLAKAVRVLSDNVDASAVILLSGNGHTTNLISRFRPETKIIVGCSDPRVYNQLNLSWGVYPYMITSKIQTVDDFYNYLTRTKKLPKNKKIVLVKTARDQIREIECI